MNDKVEEFKRKALASSRYNHYEPVKFPDNTIIQIDVREFYEMADLLASNYGIGGCKGFEEFLNILDNAEDRALNGLLKAIVARYERTYGKATGKPTQPAPSNLKIDPRTIKGHKGPAIPTTTTQPSTEQSERVGYGSSVKSNIQKTAMFLKFYGADPKKVNEAARLAREGKINIPEYDFDWINKENLFDPEFPLKEVLQQMRESEEKSINFRVNHNTLLERLKKNNG